MERDSIFERAKEIEANSVPRLKKRIAELEREVERLKARLTYYERDTVRLRCYGCSKTVSTEVSDATLFRCVAYCPECIEAGKDQDPDALEAAAREPLEQEVRDLKLCIADGLERRRLALLPDTEREVHISELEQRIAELEAKLAEATRERDEASKFLRGTLGFGTDTPLLDMAKAVAKQWHLRTRQCQEHREKLAAAQAACKRLQRQNSELDTTLSYYELNASGGLPEAMEAACKAARAEGFKEAKRLAIAIVGQRMGYTNAERVIDAIWALDGEENGTLS